MLHEVGPLLLRQADNLLDPLCQTRHGVPCQRPCSQQQVGPQPVSTGEISTYDTETHVKILDLWQAEVAECGVAHLVQAEP